MNIRSLSALVVLLLFLGSSLHSQQVNPQEQPKTTPTLEKQLESCQNTIQKLEAKLRTLKTYHKNYEKLSVHTNKLLQKEKELLQKEKQLSERETSLLHNIQQTLSEDKNLQALQINSIHELDLLLTSVSELLEKAKKKEKKLAGQVAKAEKAYIAIQLDLEDAKAQTRTAIIIGGVLTVLSFIGGVLVAN